MNMQASRYLNKKSFVLFALIFLSACFFEQKPGEGNVKHYKNVAGEIIEILPDGRIYRIDSERGITTKIYDDKGPILVMPAQRIAITDTLQITMDQLKGYYNENGRSIAEDFELYIDIRPQGR